MTWYLSVNYTRFRFNYMRNSTELSELFDPKEAQHCIVCRVHYWGKLEDVVLSKVPSPHVPF